MSLNKFKDTNNYVDTPINTNYEIKYEFSNNVI